MWIQFYFSRINVCRQLTWTTTSNPKNQINSDNDKIPVRFTIFDWWTHTHICQLTTRISQFNISSRMNLEIQNCIWKQFKRYSIRKCMCLCVRDDIMPKKKYCKHLSYGKGEIAFAIQFQWYFDSILFECDKLCGCYDQNYWNQMQFMVWNDFIQSAP